MPTTTGLSASPCYLSGKGSTCLLTLTINGSQMPANGFHEGPVLCEQENPNQCYWPDSDNQLQVSRATAPATPGHLQLSQFGSPVTSLTLQAGDSGILTLTNTGGSAVTALNIQLPFGWQSYFSNHCPTTLAPQQICTLSYTIPSVSATGIFNPLVVHATQADNILTVPVSIQTIGAAYCWGENSQGQLGIGNNTNSNTPVPVNTSTLGQDVITITGGYRHICALKQTGNVYCWGFNANGQLGIGSNVSSNMPVPVIDTDLGQDVMAITNAYFSTCALKQTRDIYCWGNNIYGQLGNGNNTPSNTPVQVIASALGHDAVAITGGAAFICALKQTGDVYCWGANNFGQLGNSNNTNSSTPVPVSTNTLGSDVVAITSGNTHACALKQTGEVYCWGSNTYGQLGNGNNTPSNTPVQVSVSALGQDVVAITGGSFQTCALKKTGDVYCWGENVDGQLGNGNNTPSNTPVQVIASTLGNDVVAIAGGESHACALKQTGEVYCWGNNGFGQLGNAGNTSSNIPVSTTAFSALMLFQHNLSTSSCAIHPSP